MKNKRYRTHNLDRHGCIPHVALSIEHDWGHVYDTEDKVLNPITGEMQDKHVFSGYMPECLAWARRKED